MPSYDENGEWIKYDYAGAAFKLGVMYYGMIFLVFAHVYSSVPKGFLDNNNVVGLRTTGRGLTEEASTAWHRVGFNRCADTIVIPPYASSWWPPAALCGRGRRRCGDGAAGRRREVVNLYDGEAGRGTARPRPARHLRRPKAPGQGAGVRRRDAARRRRRRRRVVPLRRRPAGHAPDANDAPTRCATSTGTNTTASPSRRARPRRQALPRVEQDAPPRDISAYPPIFRVGPAREVVDDLRRRRARSSSRRPSATLSWSRLMSAENQVGVAPRPNDRPAPPRRPLRAEPRYRAVRRPHAPAPPSRSSRCWWSSTTGRLLRQPRLLRRPATRARQMRAMAVHLHHAARLQPPRDHPPFEEPEGRPSFSVRGADGGVVEARQRLLPADPTAG